MCDTLQEDTSTHRLKTQKATGAETPLQTRRAFSDEAMSELTETHSRYRGKFICVFERSRDLCVYSTVCTAKNRG